MPAWRLKWTHGAIAALKELPWREAARVDAAVLGVAEGEGRLEVVRGDPRGFRLRIRPCVVRLEFDEEEGVLWVLAVFRADR